MPRTLALFSVLALFALAAAVACSSIIQYPGELVGSFDTALLPRSNSCAQFAALPGFCPENGSPGPCTDGGYPDGGTTVLVVSTNSMDAGYLSYRSGSQSATASGSWDGQTVRTQASASRFFILANQPSADAGCVAAVTESIQLTIYASLDGGCDGGIPLGPPPEQIGGVYQTQTSPACGLLVDYVAVMEPLLCCPDVILDGGADGGPICGTTVPPPCVVSFGLVGQGRSSPP